MPARAWTLFFAGLHLPLTDASWITYCVKSTGKWQEGKAHNEMNWKIGSLRTNLYLISAILLVTGLGSAAFIYQAAMNDPDNASGYEVIGGFVYSSNGENSKRYIHDLERFGGKAAVLSDEFMHWFSGLWHGKSLAWTVVCITVFISLCLFVAANVSAHARSRVSPENKRDRTD